MADDNDNGLNPGNAAQAPTAGTGEAGPTAAGATAARPSANAEATGPEASRPGATGPEAANPESAKDAKATTPKGDPKEREQTFEVLQNALENVDWGYKLKSGEDRDVGHKSAMIAERAFIAASVFDAKEAEKLYEQFARRPPKEELIKRADAHRAALAGPNAPTISIPDLTAGIASVGQRRELSKLHSNKDEIEKKLGNWKTTLGDSESRSKSHMKAGNDQLLSQEKPREDGLHIFAAIKSGWRGAGEYSEMLHHRGHVKETLTTVKEQTDEHKAVVKMIEEFGQVPGPGGKMKDTTGPNGQNVARFQKAFGVVKAAMAKPGSGIVGEPPAGKSKAQSPTAKMAAEAARNAGQGL